MQGYAGSSSLVERCLTENAPPLASRRNGMIFTDGDSPKGGKIVDSILRVTGPHRSSNWVANCHYGPFDFTRCLVDGRTVDSSRYKCTFHDCEIRS
jgi:hypothetical protein